MNTIKYQKHQIKEVAAALSKGAVIAFPTDTVYGLAVCFDNPTAITKMKEVKGRDENKPFPVMVSSLTQIEEVAYLTKRDYGLIKKWLPGAMTFLFLKKDSVSNQLTNGLNTIAVRMPDDEFVLELIELIGKPLLVTSANISGQPSVQTATEVLEQLEGLIDGIVIGEAAGKIASTIIDASTKELKVVRQGNITLEEVNKSLKEEEGMRIAIGSDHGAYHHKEYLKEWLLKQNYEVIDCGTNSEDSVDYPDYAYAAAKEVVKNTDVVGIVLCGTGVGASIAANKVHGVRCALVNDKKIAAVTRDHNDANVLAMGGRVISVEEMIEIVKLWLNTPFSEDSRHQKRIAKIRKIEEVECDER